MLIRCPDCEFEREINTATIPGSATLATCPRCGTKFRFRDPETGAPLFVEEDRPSLRHVPGGKGQEASPPPHLPTEQEGDDPLPPGAIIPKLDVTPAPTPVQTDSTPRSAARQNQTPDKAEQTPSPVGDSPTPEIPLPIEPAVSPSTRLAKEAQPAPLEGKGEEERGYPAKRQDHSGDLPSRDANPSAVTPPVDPLLLPTQHEETLGKTEMYQEDSGEWQEPEVQTVPWEAPEVYGFLGSFIHTLLGAMFRPAAFFRAVGRSEGSLARPVIFFLLLEFFSTLFWVIWSMGPLRALLASAPTPETQAVFAQLLEVISTPLFLLLVPFTGLFSLALMALFYYAFLSLAQPDRVSFITVVKVLCYSSAPRVLAVVPFLGLFAGFLWSLALSFIGCRFALGLTWGRVSLALVPMFLLGMALYLRMGAMVVGSM